MHIEQLDLFGNSIPTPTPAKSVVASIVEQKPIVEFLDNEPIVYIDDNIIVKVKSLKEDQLNKDRVEKRGRKSYKELEATADLINIPSEEILQQKLYYSIGEVAEWFGVNTSQIRFWENEFDILQPRKTKKGDRLFRIEDIRNLELIHHLLRVKKLSIEGAKDYLKNNKSKVDSQFTVTQTLTKLKSFLLELKLNLETA